METTTAQPPRWAQRVKQSLIRRLYETDAMGICDEKLIDETGYALLARCESFIAAMAAFNGRATCPGCGEVIPHDRKPETLLHCAQCGWEMVWRDYFKTFQHRQLSGDEQVQALFQSFIAGFIAARTPQQKMVWIDFVIHGFHQNLITGPRRTTGVNLIEGNYHEVVQFLAHLTYGNASTPGLQELHADWRQKINHTADIWNDDSLRLS